MSDFLEFDFFPTGIEAASPQVVFPEPRLNSKSQAIHDRAQCRAKTYLIAEAQLLESILEIDLDRTFEKFGETHLTPYCVKHLRLTSDIAANFVRVARKSREVPELLEAVRQGSLTVTKAKAISSVLTPRNKVDWIEKAKALSKEKLEWEVAKAAPQASKPEKAKAIGAETFRLEYELTREVMEMFRRAQDIASQSLGKSASLEDTQKEILKVFLHYRDPFEKAVRAKARQEKKPSGRSRDHSQDGPSKNQNRKGKARQYPAALVHAINFRDKRRCQAQIPDGAICGSARWVHFHHVLEIERGGRDTLENMTTLCSSHHRAWHKKPGG